MADQSDVAVLNATCAREHGRLLGILTLHTGDRWVAEELANEALVALCERWPSGPRIEDPRAWLTRVALNLANSWLRRRIAERRAKARLDARPVEAVDPDSADAVAVRSAVSALPRRQREALVLRYWAGCTAAEAAEAMGIEAATVRALTHQAVTALRTTFAFDLEEVANDR